MKLLTRTATAYSVSNGKALAVTIPADFAREMELTKGSELTIVYEPKTKTMIVSFPPLK